MKLLEEQALLMKVEYTTMYSHYGMSLIYHIIVNLQDEPTQINLLNNSDELFSSDHTEIDPHKCLDACDDNDNDDIASSVVSSVTESSPVPAPDNMDKHLKHSLEVARYNNACVQFDNYCIILG